MARIIGTEIERLIQLLAKLPGLGPRSARRAALHLIKKRETLMSPLTAALSVALEKITTCETCGNIDTSSPCMVCRDVRRALERANVMGAAKYHVLGGTLSPLDGIRPEDLHLKTLVTRIEEEGFSEVILALNATIDGQTTAHYITDLLVDAGVKITKPAHGLPVGGELDYLDDGTLATALRSRIAF
jgi:recombination protein RecR